MRLLQNFGSFKRISFQQSVEFPVRIGGIWLLSVCLLALLPGQPVQAHDTWVEANTALVRAGDAVYVSLKLGNHGNDHRDFKIAGKLDLEGSTLGILLPNGQTFDMRDQLADVGYAPNEGYWTGKFVGGAAGTYSVLHTLDKVVNHGRPVRSIKSAKAFFLAGTSLDRVKDETETWKKPAGHPLELVPVSHPVLFTGPGLPIEVQVLKKGVPMADARVSFIPEGTVLKTGFDDVYERKTDANGHASFTPRTGCRLLIVTHDRAEDEKSGDYDLTTYSATIQMLVPDICPCCQ